ncbi:hypothetical protein GBK02_02515 [Dechloromonas sp. TW-R-39-2]|uniref:hypothetical protein n=1 Tax=Dechloromonas sp. TW-R-39-2 TaxID=2654218 RepID=UPI00193C9775|nr:hypothetical protein [Dechloromonas sp. TW-R-39-2]QRM18348.1 hypothetical protein GBK02_02515 [Dechloromonas sp. TW-R-39-2]
MSWHKYKKSLLKIYRRLRCSLLGGHRILILGDSHAGVFEYVFDHDLLTPHLLNCEIVGGATAGGLNNDHSVTAAFAKYQQSLRRFAEYDVVVLMLGEVDCSFALWNRAKQRNESVFEQIPRAMQGIVRLLDWAGEHYPQRRFVLAGTILPTIKDDEIDLQYYELRRSVRATQRERSELVLAFNQAVRQLAGQRGLSYMDISQQTIDAEKGVVRDEFLVHEKLDHHQSQAMTAPLWVEEFRRVLDEPAQDGAR